MHFHVTAGEGPLTGGIAQICEEGRASAGAVTVAPAR
jgi:hypothetical protein